MVVPSPLRNPKKQTSSDNIKICLDAPQFYGLEGPQSRLSKLLKRTPVITTDAESVHEEQFKNSEELIRMQFEDNTSKEDLQPSYKRSLST